MIDTFPEPKKIKDTYKGKQLIKKRDELLEKLRQYEDTVYI